MAFQAGQMSYVICPHCEDPVAGRIPSGSEARKLTCVHCRQTFTFADNEILTGIVGYDDSDNRWKVQRMTFARLEEGRGYPNPFA